MRWRLLLAVLLLWLFPAQFSFSAEREILLSDGTSLRGWGFSDGGEFPGAKGKISVTGKGIRLEGDFSGGGAYVAALYFGEMPPFPRFLSWTLELAEPMQMTLRVVDGNSRTFQTGALPLAAGTQLLKVDLRNTPWAASWPSRETDPHWTEMVFPLQRIDLCIPKGRNVNPGVLIKSLKAESSHIAGTFDVSNFRLTGTPESGKRCGVEFTAQSDSPILVRAMIGDFPLANTARRVVMPKKGVNQLELPLPEFLGSGGKYRMELCDPVTGQAFASVPFRIGGGAEATDSPSLERALLKAAREIEAEVAAPVAGILQVWLFCDGKLYDTAQKAFRAGEKNVSIPIPAAWEKMFAGRDCELEVMVSPGTAGSGRMGLSITFPGKEKSLPKPMNYGIFSDRFGTTHPWYINRNSEYILDGRPYFPVGGMWCPKFISGGTRERLEYDLGVLEEIRSGGLNDVYFNSGRGRLHQLQYFIDLMEKNDIEYGMQYSAGYDVPEGLFIESFFLRKDQLTRGIYRGGRLELNFPKELKAVGFLLLPEVGAQRNCIFVPHDDTEGNAEREQIFDLDSGKDLSRLRGVRVSVELPVAEGTRFLVIPKISAKMTHFNFWNPDIRRRLRETQKWIGSIEWGPNFRYFIDPVMNETHMLLDTENLRQHTPEINADFAAWLRKRYQTSAALSAAWDVESGIDFDTASRLVPQRLGDELLLLDPETGNVFRAGLKKSRMHFDYNEMIRSTYSCYVDEFARYLKSMVNVPVVDKNVGAYGSPLHVSTLYCGVDGAGFEVYLNQGLPQENNGGATRAAADASPHTVWKAGTELGHSAAIGNDDVRFFRDEAELRLLTEGLSSLGVKGFLFFGFELQPIDWWRNHSYNRYPEGMAWAKRAEEDYVARPRAVTPRAYLFPASPCNIGRTGISRYSALYDGPASAFRLSVRIRGDEWASLTEVLPAEIDRLFLNLPNPPFSLHYGPEAARGMERAEEVYYLGSRNDLGAFPEIDRYFTSERITFADNSSAQVLKVPAGAELLAAENGKPWAIRDGKIVIVSREPVLLANNRGATGFRYLRTEWIPERNYFTSGAPVILGSIDTGALGLVSNSAAVNQVPAAKVVNFPLPVTVRNLTAAAETLELTAQIPEGVRLLEAPGKIRLESGAVKQVEFTFDLSGALKERDGVELAIEERDNKLAPMTLSLTGRRWQQADVPVENRLDAASWIELSPFSWFAVTVKAADVKAKFRAGYRPDALVIEAEVEDPVHCRADAPEKLWMFDSIQLAFSPLRNGEVSGGDFAEIGVGDSVAGPVCFAYSALPGGRIGLLKDSHVEFRREKERSFYRITLDAAELKLPELKPGSGLAFSLLVNSNDGSGRGGYLHWGDGIGSGKNPQEFNLFEFK